ncbi:hypothetical protein FDP41_009588 [Naegleria fowleri]|uniref:Uncharacterized protein n=1 Tax=Naegleria fowleri TaxID=5763 RepID=A0A6A5B9T0_NAEFO|nr:uncharacterized protein FDP41_009588 [Naegleria fowleri]KAF0971892.1 hypothetical protein FDP41_009588 [Naegleria fowleri]
MLTTPSKAITLPPSSSATPSSSCSSLSIHQEHQEEGDMLLRRVVASNFVGNGTPPPSPPPPAAKVRKNKTRKFTFNVMDSPAESFSSSDGLSSSQRLDKLRSLSISMEQDKVQEVERLIVDHSPKGTNTQCVKWNLGMQSDQKQKDHYGHRPCSPILETDRNPSHVLQITWSALTWEKVKELFPVMS